MIFVLRRLAAEAGILPSQPQIVNDHYNCQHYTPVAFADICLPQSGDALPVEAPISLNSAG